MAGAAARMPSGNAPDGDLPSSGKPSAPQDVSTTNAPSRATPVTVTFGASPSNAEVAVRPLRSLEEIAIENAREGCVRECYGAALGWYQARSASDAGIAAAMAQIAEDETNHAGLAFAVDACARSRLDERSRVRVAAARAEAVTALRCELTVAPDPSTRAVLGLPDPIAALRLCTALEQPPWA